MPDPDPSPLGDPGELFRLATQALQVLGVRQDQIDAIAADDRADGLLPLLAPIGGLVIKKTSIRASMSPEGTLLFEIADLGHVWVHAQVFEDQLALVRVGQPVAATVPAFPGEEFQGQSSSPRARPGDAHRSRCGSVSTTPTIGSGPGCSPPWP